MIVNVCKQYLYMIHDSVQVRCTAVLEMCKNQAKQDIISLKIGQ